MNVAGMIEWLKTMPQDAKVLVLEHYSGSGYYEQGGNCYTADFTDKVDYQQWKEEGDTSPVEYVIGDHFELFELDGEILLQIGVTGK